MVNMLSTKETKMYPKYRKDGMVAVLYSPGYGAGWYSWNTAQPEMLFDPVIVEAVLNGMNERDLYALAEERYPDTYVGGIEQITIEWLPESTMFRIEEYDGSENVVTYTNDVWFKA
jgi:hypothetical protein